MLIQSDVGLLSMLQKTSTVSKVVLVILLVFSVWSWGIILSKALLFRKVRAESDSFWRLFKKGQNLSVIGTACAALQSTPLVQVFNSGAVVLAKKSPSTYGLERTIPRASAS